MENYVFIPVTEEEAESKGFPSAIGSFSELFDVMKQQISRKQLNKKNIGNALNMTTDEKSISFLNNYFIFKKVRNVDAKQITLQTLSKTERGSKEDEAKINMPVIRSVRKYKKKLILPK